LLLAIGLLSSCEVRRPPPPAAPLPVQTLFDAARTGDVALASSLISQGADVNAADAEKLTPLHVAAFGGHVEVIRLLLAARADIGARDVYGFTPLHAAAREGHLAAVQALVEGGADVNAKDADNFSPVQVASFMQRQDVMDYLYAHGATREEEPAAPVVVEKPAPEIPPAIVLTGANFRAWTSASGSQVEAEFVQCVMDMVTLRKNDGALVRIQLNQLTPADQVAVRQLDGTLPPVLTRQRTARLDKPRQSIGERVGDEKGWDMLTDCKLLRKGANDGDSFHVMAKGKERIFRLYYVDAAETSLSFPERVADQAKYFNLDERDTLRLGEEAKKFTDRVLSKGSFTVVTKWEDARGNSRLPREYAFVVTDQGDLDELLMAEGLVRLYGMRIDGPFGSKKYNELKDLERDAKREKAGAWGLGKDETVAATR
jgi:endonuclease YncB( thermonuclease family)